MHMQIQMGLITFRFFDSGTDLNKLCDIQLIFGGGHAQAPNEAHCRQVLPPHVYSNAVTILNGWLVIVNSPVVFSHQPQKTAQGHAVF